MEKIKGVQPSTVSGWAMIGSSIILTIGSHKVSELYQVIMDLTIEQFCSLIIALLVGVYNIWRDEYKHIEKDGTEMIKLPTIYKHNE